MTIDLHARHKRLLEQQAALAALTQSHVLHGDNLEQALQLATETAARLMRIERVSLWRYTQARSAIRCVDLFELSAKRHSAGAELRAEDYPAYFHALAGSEAIVANDAHADPRTCELSSSYLAPLGITAMMDIPIQLQARLGGVLCHEQVGPPVPWTPEDRLLGIAMANLIAFAIERHERLRAEEALRESEQRLATLVAYAPDAIAILDVDSFRLIEANEQAARLYGLERNALLALGPVELSPERQPDGRPSDEAAREKIQEALEGGTPVFEWLHLNASGEPFPCEVRLVRLPHATCRLIRASIIDITERKRLQEKLVEERALLRALIDSIPDYIFVKDTESVYVVCNKATAEFFNADEAEIIGRTDFDFVDHETAESFRARDRAILEAGRALCNEEWLNYADGRRLLVETVKTPFYGPDGWLLGLIGVARDITERRRAEAALRESEQRLATIVAYAPEAMTILDADTGRWIDVNEKAEQIFGFDRTSLLQRGPVALSPREQPDGRPSTEAARGYIYNALNGGAPIFEWVHSNAAGESIPCEIRLVRLPQSGRNLVRASLIDITERKRAQAELRAAKEAAEAASRALAQTHAELELRVEQRTGELRAAHARLQEELAERERAESEKARLEAQLRQAQKLEAIGTLAGGIAHDFNNILGAILGYAEMALDAVPAGGNLQRYLGNVMAAANRAKDLVDQILAFTQPGSREHVPVRLGPLLGEVAELIKASLPEKIELKLRVNAEDATVQGDVIRLHQLVMNVCTNAVQAMPEGGLLEIALDVIELSERMVQRHHTLEPGTYVRLKVTDTGHGIDEATLDRVFDPFFITKDLGLGTGLGLSLAHSIVSDHGGAIEVSSTPGQGSSFTVYLPRSGETASASGIERVPIPKGRGETVLLVDDDEALVLLGEEMIAALGYEPIGFQDSQAALEAFQARPARFDLVVTDQLMPRMSGTELAMRLREIRPDIPVLFMSGFGGPELAHKAQRAAVQALLKKPLQSRDLAQAIASALNVNKKFAADSQQ